MRSLLNSGPVVVVAMLVMTALTAADPHHEAREMNTLSLTIEPSTRTAPDPVIPIGPPLDIEHAKDWLENVDRLEHQAQSSPQEALKAVAMLGGIDPAESPPVDRFLVTEAMGLAMLEQDGVDITGLHGSLIGPVARLYAAVGIAESMRAQATSMLTPQDIALVDSLVKSDTKIKQVQADLERIQSSVDQALLVQATLLVLDTIDETTPVLKAARDLLPERPRGTGECSGPPELIDHPPYLALDGEGSALFDKDYRLIIDLGGDDCYENETAVGDNEVTVVLDLGGDDTYRRSSTTGGVQTQAVGILGIGILVDLGGADVFEARSIRTAPQPGPAAGRAEVLAQGAGALGVGVLVSGFGEDRFLMEARSSGGNTAVTGQGAANLGGVGLLHSTGGLTGDTEYIARSVSTLHQTLQTPTQQTYVKGAAETQAQAAATLGGAAGLVDTLGDDRYTALAHGLPATLVAQGAGASGVGVLVDGTGHDVFTAEAIGDVDLSLIVSDTNFCWIVTVNVNTSDTVLIAHGGAEGGAGVLVASGAGENAYHADATSRATAHAEVAMSASSNCPNEARATASSGSARLVTQGAANGGAGVLVGGTDSDYREATGTTQSIARALVNHGIRTMESASASSGVTNLRAHGAGAGGVGISLDPAGDDAYTSSVSAWEQEVTNSGTTTRQSGTNARSEGWATGGVGWLIDMDGDDTYTTPIAANDHCWSQPGSTVLDPQLARGRDFTPDTLPLLIATEVCP